MKINQRIFDQYGIDTTKNLNINQRCARPFDTVLIDKNGSCYACECQAWLPQSIGNLHRDGLLDILTSNTRKGLQNSVSDNTYRYCNERQCTYIQKNMFDQHSHAGLKHLRLAIDDSCNLSCPSCRRSKKFLYKGKMFQMRVALSKKIIEFLSRHDTPLQVHIGSDGDPFASVVYRGFMKAVPDVDRLTYSFQTNGLLFQQMFARVQKVIRRTKRVAVSVDGATKKTYEKLRRGAEWQKILSNLDFIGNHKSMGYRFEIHMVVQNSNWREMEMMLELARKVGADSVNFSLISDWGTFDRFTENYPPTDNVEFIEMLERCQYSDLGNTWLSS